MLNVPRAVILHCSDTPDYKPGSPDFDSIGASDIDRWHRQRGFDKVGYHRIIRQSGVIEIGRLDHEIGAHVYGMNVATLGVCLIGRRNFTPEQVEALFTLYKEIKTKHGINYLSWFCHYTYDSQKTCPNIPISVLRALLKRR